MSKRNWKNSRTDYIADEPNAFDSWKEKGKIEFIEFDDLQKEKIIDGYYASAYLVEHGSRKPAYGYVIEKENKAIGFSGDSTYCENIDKIINNSNMVVLDMTFLKGCKTHMGMEDMESISKRFDKIIVATHMSSQARKVARKKKIKNLIIPNDGEEIEI